MAKKKQKATKQKAIFADSIFAKLDAKDKQMTASIGKMDNAFKMHKKKGD
jgi:hypothetical protein